MFNDLMENTSGNLNAVWFSHYAIDIKHNFLDTKLFTNVNFSRENSKLTLFSYR